MNNSLRTLVLPALLIAACSSSAPPPSTSTPTATVAAITTAPTVAATTPAPVALSCGTLTSFGGGPSGDPKYLLTISSGQTSTQYRLSGSGTAPSDLGAQFSAKTPQVIQITGRLVPVNSDSPQAVNMMDFTVARVGSCTSP